MQKQTDVVVMCPDCENVYVQRVTGKYNGPRRRCRNAEYLLRERCCAAGQVEDEKSWYGLMFCAECSIKRAPPALQETMRKWLKEGERSL